MSRYAIWNKEDKIYTPIGEMLTPEQWIARYPIAGSMKTVVAGNTINGGYFGVFNQMIEVYTSMGCDFSKCTEDQDYLDTIEAFEDEQNSKSMDSYTDQTRIADALEDLVVLQLTTEMEE